MKHIIGQLILFVLTLTLLAGCGTTTTSPAQASSPPATTQAAATIAAATATTQAEAEAPADGKLTDTPITLSYWVGLDGNAAVQLNSYSENPVYIAMEELTGITIEFEHPTIGQENEQFNLLIASRDFPDFIETGWNSYSGGPQKAINDNVIIKLDDLLQSHAPDAYAMMTSSSVVEKQCKTDEGSFYAFMAVAQPVDFVDDIQGGLMLRSDWLAELGLSEPATLEDWETVLTAFKDQKGVEIPFTIRMDTLKNDNSLIGPFGIGPRYYQKDGKVAYGPVQPEYKDYLAMLNRWYTNGLLDPDFASIDAASVNAKMSNGTAAATWGMSGGGLGTYLTANADNPDYDLVGIQYPLGLDGSDPMFMSRAWEVRTSGSLAITTNNKYPELSSQWANYFYTEPGGLLKNFGIEGVSYTLVDGLPQDTELLSNNPDGLSRQQALGVYSRGSTPSPGPVIKIASTVPQQKAAMETWNTFANNSVKVLIPPISQNSEEAEKLAVLEANINAYQEEQMVKFIMGQESLDNFDKFVQQLMSYNIEEVIALKQAALDRYNSR